MHSELEESLFADVTDDLLHHGAFEEDPDLEEKRPVSLRAAFPLVWQKAHNLRVPRCD